MTSIRRRTAALVALSMTALLVIGGAVLLVVLRRAMTAQFDDALAARVAALQSLTRFDGAKVEMDFAGEAMPRYARSPTHHTDAEYFVVWVREGSVWRALEHSESLKDDTWPPVAWRDGPEGVRDVTLPGGGTGRAVLIEFSAASERDEEGDQHGERTTVARAASAVSLPVVRLMVALPRAPLDRTLSLIGWYIAGVGGALALAGIAASRWAVSRGLVPLSELSGRVQTLGPDSLGSRFELDDLPAELRPIAEQLSALLARLEEAFEREKRFSAAASHELRTPITELRLLLEVASSQARTSEEWVLTCATALGVLSRAQALCETLLRLAHASAERSMGTLDAHSLIGPILMAQVTRVVVAHGGDARRVRLECEDGLVVPVEQTTLASIVGNLIDNALRHGNTTPECPAHIRATRFNNRVRIQVSNLAPGLSHEDLSHLFEPFWRKDLSRHEQDGFGLGLSVARTLARASGGELDADLDPPGSLRVRLFLPVVP